MKPAFKLGQTVYHQKDLQQLPKMVIAITLQAGGSIVYTVADGDGNNTYHHEIELQPERDVILATSNFNDKN